MSGVHHVTYYAPFTHYWGLDAGRLGFTGLALIGLVFVLVLGSQRWHENRRSATYFLVAIATAMAECGYGSILTLGHPYSWAMPFRGALLVITFLASGTALSEYRQPGALWDPTTKERS